MLEHRIGPGGRRITAWTASGLTPKEWSDLRQILTEPWTGESLAASYELARAMAERERQSTERKHEVKQRRRKHQ